MISCLTGNRTISRSEDLRESGNPASPPPFSPFQQVYSLTQSPRPRQRALSPFLTANLHPAKASERLGFVWQSLSPEDEEEREEEKQQEEKELQLQ